MEIILPEKLNEEVINSLSQSLIVEKSNLVWLDVQLSAIEKAVKMARESIKSAVIVQSETVKEINGIKLVKKSGYNMFDYSNDKLYSELELKLSERKEMLNLAIKAKQDVLIESGELLHVVPVKTKVSGSISYKF